MSARDDLAAVIGLACLTEDRGNEEQRALLRVAASVDNAFNAANRENTPRRGAPLSLLLVEVEESRVLHEGQREVRLPPKDRAKWERKVAGWEKFAMGGEP